MGIQTLLAQGTGSVSVLDIWILGVGWNLLA